MTWTSALKATARAGLTIERTKLEPLVALRGACGVAIVIGVNLWLFTPQLAVASAFGAFASGLATFQRSWRPRPVLALAVAAGLAFSTFIGYMAIADPVVFAVLLALWTLLAGMAWAIGPVSGMVASQMVAVMLFTVTLPTSVLGALHHAGLILFGGLVQAALIVVFPIRPWGRQRDVLADALAAEADYARRLRHDPVARFDPQPLMDARSAAALTPRQARRRPHQLAGPRGLAERLRPVLASLADPVTGAPPEGPERDRVRELLGAAAAVLDAVAHAVRWGKPVKMTPEVMATLDVPDEDRLVLHGAARRSGLRLLVLLADVVEAADERVESTRPAAPGERRHLLRPSVPRLVPVGLRALRREARWSSAIGRHAVRVTAVVSAGYALGNALPLGHGYWAPMTSVMVMRPDFAQTFSRGVARFAGTVVGVWLAGGLMVLVHPGTYVCAALAVLCIALMYLLLRTGYSVASTCLAAYVVFLLGIAGEGWSQTVWARLTLTLLGGLLALTAYALFPAWETLRLRDRLADWLHTNGRYSLAVLAVYALPADRRPRRVREALLDSRAARLEWEEAVARAEKEPVRHRGISRRAERGAESALATMGRATMLMEAHMPDREAGASPGAGTFAAALRAALPEAESAVRERRPLDWSAPHRAHAAWRAAAGEEGVAVRASELLLDALDELADALTPGRRATQRSGG